MQRIATLALLAGLAAGARAWQEPEAASSAKEALQKLVADHDAAVAAYWAKVRQLTATEEWQQAEAAKDPSATAALRAKVPPVDRGAFARRAAELAGKFRGDDAVPLHGLAVVYGTYAGGDTDCAKAAVAALRRDHTRSPALVSVLERGGVIARAVGDEDANAFLDEVAANNPDKLARAWALYWRGTPLAAGDLATADDKARGAKLLAQAEELAAGTLLADRIAAPRFEKERLQIGMEVPEIEGVDMNGTPFKLSDYRGKVLVLDFWGFW
jgi:hypothetical protein